MRTGDILLFESNYKGPFGWWAWVVSLVTRSRFTHVAMILVDPTYIDESYKGIYVIESGSEEWAHGWGTIVSPLEKIIESKQHRAIYHRKLQTAIDVDKIVRPVFVTVKDRPYDTDIMDLVENALHSRLLVRPRELDRFVCSSLVAYMYTALGLLPPDTEWFFWQPWHFSSQNAELRLTWGSWLEQEIHI